MVISPQRLIRCSAHRAVIFAIAQLSCHLFCVSTLLPRDATQSAVLLRQVVCLFVCLSVTLRYHDHIGWNSSKIISRYLPWVFALRKTPTSRIYSKGNTRNFGRNTGGVRKSGFRRTKALISLKCGKIAL